MNKTLCLLILVASLATGITSKLHAEEKNKSLLGEWLYEVSDAPYGYEKGSLIFAEKEGKTVCTVKLEAGELSVDKLTIEKEKINFSTNVDGNQIQIKLTREKNKLTGIVETPEGEKTISAVKK